MVFAQNSAKQLEAVQSQGQSGDSGEVLVLIFGFGFVIFGFVIFGFGIFGPCEW